MKQKALISRNKEIAAQPTFGISSTSNYTLANLSGSINTPTIYTNASTASLNLQTEPFSNSIGSMISTLQCVDPTEVHIEGYLSPTDRLAERSDATQEKNKKNPVDQIKLPSISRHPLISLPSNMDCSGVDFASVNEELLSPANFSTYDNAPSGHVQSIKIENPPKISSPRDVPVFSMPDHALNDSSKKDGYDISSTSPIRDTGLLSSMKTECAGQKFIDMGVEFHMMLKKQNQLKKQATSLRHNDRLVPISTGNHDDGEPDIEEDEDDEIEDTFNWDKLL